MADDNLDHLAPGFDPSSLTIPRLRSILVYHNVNYPASAKKSQLIDIFNQKVVPHAPKILAAQSRVKRSSKGIEDVPSSQSTVDEEEDRQRMRPPPIPDTPRRGSRRRTTQAQTDGSADDEPVRQSSAGRTPGRPPRRVSTKPARPIDEDSGVEMATEKLAPPKRTRKSISPAANQEPRGPEIKRKTDADDSPFTQDNPFQSGSSPAEPETRAVSGERRRKTLDSEEKKDPRRRSKPTQRSEVAPTSRRSSSKTIEMSIARVKREDVVEPSAGEEFTPDEQEELAIARAGNNDKDILPARRRPRPSSASSAVLKLATSLISLSAAVGFGVVWRQEKIEIGYCGVGRVPSTDIQGVDVPDWAASLLPECEPCPPHAFCSQNLATTCEDGFVLQPHPLSFGGVIPLPPSCEADGDKAKRVQLVVDKAVQELRERNAKFECGELVDETTGKQASSPVLDATQLKAEVSSMKKRAMNQEEFEDLWRSALPEIVGREEVVVESDGPPDARRLNLRSESTARIPFGCAVRRSLRLTLERYLWEILAFAFLLSGSFYTRFRITSNRADEERAKLLASSALNRLAGQAAVAKYEGGDDAYISMAQLRDDVLRDEFSATRRKKLWDRVKKKVENNSNVRPMVRESKTGDVSRVWEWVGAVAAIEDGGRRESGRRESSRLSLGLKESPSMSELRDPGAESVPGRPRDTVKWEDEGRPIY